MEKNQATRDFVEEYIWPYSYRWYTESGGQAVLVTDAGKIQLMPYPDFLDWSEHKNPSITAVMALIRLNTDAYIGARWFSQEEFDALLEMHPEPRYEKNANYWARALNEPISNFEIG